MELGSTSTFDIDYPPDHPDPKLAGQRVTFQVQLKGLAWKELPNLDDEFAKDHGECETLSELRERVLRHLEARAAHEADRLVRGNVMRQLVGANEVEVPRAMVERRTDALVDEFFHELGSQRPPASREAEFRARLRAELEPRAREQVQGGLILESIAQQERLEVSEDDLQAYVDQVAEQAQGGAGERIRALYQDPPRREGLRAQLLQEKALELVVTRAHLHDVEAKSAVADAKGTG
jgi:trigger factor